MSLKAIGTLFQNRFQLSSCRIQVALVSQPSSQIQARIYMLGIEAESLLELPDGVVYTSFAEVSGAQAVARGGALRVRLESLLEVRYGFAILLAGDQQLSQVAVGHEIIRILLQ